MCIRIYYNMHSPLSSIGDWVQLKNVFSQSLRQINTLVSNPNNCDVNSTSHNAFCHILLSNSHVPCSTATSSSCSPTATGVSSLQPFYLGQPLQTDFQQPQSTTTSLVWSSTFAVIPGAERPLFNIVAPLKSLDFHVITIAKMVPRISPLYHFPLATFELHNFRKLTANLLKNNRFPFSQFIRFPTYKNLEFLSSINEQSCEYLSNCAHDFCNLQNSDGVTSES